MWCPPALAVARCIPPALVPRSQSPLSYTPRHLAEKILTSRVALEVERKPVTVLFCDLANSTPLAERLGTLGEPDKVRQALAELPVE